MIKLYFHRPITERRATSPTRRNKDKLKAVDSDLEIENEEVRVTVF